MYCQSQLALGMGTESWAVAECWEVGGPGSEEEEEEEDARYLRKALLQQGWWHQRAPLAGGGFQKLAQDLAAVFFSPSLRWHKKAPLVCSGTDTMI